MRAVIGAQVANACKQGAPAEFDSLLMAWACILERGQMANGWGSNHQAREGAKAAFTLSKKKTRHVVKLGMNKRELLASLQRLPWKAQ